MAAMEAYKAVGGSKREKGGGQVEKKAKNTTILARLELAISAFGGRRGIRFATRPLSDVSFCLYRCCHHHWRLFAPQAEGPADWAQRPLAMA